MKKTNIYCVRDSYSAAQIVYTVVEIRTSLRSLLQTDTKQKKYGETKKRVS